MDLVALGRRIRALRKRAGLTLEGLAELSDLHANYLGEVERGQKNASIETLSAIAEALGVSYATMLDGYEGHSEASLRRMVRVRLKSMTAVELRKVLRVLDAVR